MKIFTRASNEWALVAVASNARGVVAVGGVAMGVVAIGINAVGIVALGVNAIGSVLACGVANAVAFAALSAVNGIGVLALAPVNAMGGAAGGYVNVVSSPVLALFLGVAMLVAGFVFPGRMRPRLAPGRTTLAGLVETPHGEGWVKLRIAEVHREVLRLVEPRGTEVFDAPCDPRVIALASPFVGREALVLVARGEESVATDGSYRAPAARRATYRALDVEAGGAARWLPGSTQELALYGRWSLRVLGASSALVALTVLVTALVR